MGVIAYNKIISQQKINIYSFNFKKNFLKNIFEKSVESVESVVNHCNYYINSWYTFGTFPHLSANREIQKKLKKK